MESSQDISLKLVPFAALRDYVNIGFGGDKDLLEKYAHKEHGSFEAMVDVNMNTISDGLQDGYPLRCYAVMEGETPIGFTVLMESEEVRLLYSFGISINHRTKASLEGWIEAINRKFGGLPYAVTIYSPNTRAAAFFERNGFTNRTETPQIITLWQYQQELQLQD